MKNIFIYCVFLISFTIKAQTFEVITNKGTLKTIDNSKWTLLGNDIFNKNSGNVGIGTSAPSQKLHVTGSIYLNAENSAFVVGAGTSSPLGFVKKTGSFPFIGAGFNTPIIFSQLSTFGQGNILGNIGSSFVERMRIDGTGNVGIGGSIPTSLLHLSGPTNFPAGNLLRYIQISNFNTGNTSNDGTIIGINAAGETQINNRETLPIIFSTSNAERMRIDANGNVGIGTNNPTSKLEIQGDLRISGGIIDSSGDIGTAGQILSSTGTLTNWVSTNALMWGLSGNSGTNPTTNFIGTTDNQDFVFRTNNIERLRIFNYASPIGVLGLGRNTLTGVNGGASTFSGPTLFFGDAGNISTNTGLDFIIDDDNNATNTQFTFKANGDGNTGTVELMQINEDGRVGIGTNSPTAILDVNGQVRFRTLAAAATTDNFVTADTNGNLTKSSTTLNNTFWGLLGNSGTNPANNFIGTTDNVDFRVRTNNVERISVTAAGNVGIGTTTPSELLSLGGDVARTIQMERPSTAGLPGNSLTVMAGGASGGSNRAGGNLILSSGISTGNAANSTIEFRTATPGAIGTADRIPSTKMTILGNGNVGIGTTTPTTLLHIAGTASTSPVLITNTSTTGIGLSVENNAASTGTGRSFRVNGNNTSIGTVAEIQADGLTSGTGLLLSSSSNSFNAGKLLHLNYTNSFLSGAGRLLSITGNSVTGGTLAEIQANGLTTGTGLLINSNSTLNNASGRLLRIIANNAEGFSGTSLAEIQADELLLGSALAITSSTTNGNTLSGNLLRVSYVKPRLNGKLISVTLSNLTTGSGTGIDINTGSLSSSSKALSISTGTLGTRASALNISSNNNEANTEGVIKVVNTAASGAGIFAALQANATAGSGLTILNNGNVGIGTTSPTAQLHSTGTVQFEGLGTNTANTNILTTDANGNVTTRELSNFLSGSALTSLNGLTNSTQTFAIGTSGTDFNINSSTATHTFNFPNASSINRGLLTAADWTTFNNKIGTVTATTAAAVNTVGNTATINNTSANWNANQLQGNNVATTAPNTDGQVLTWNATNSNWEPRTSVINNLAEIYLDTPSIILTDTFQDLVFSSNGIIDSDFNTTTTSITVSNAGRYEISYRATAQISNNERSGGEFYLDIDGAESPGTRSYTYNRQSSVNRNTVTTIKISDLNAGAVVKVKGRRYAGTTGALYLVGGSSLIVKRLK